MEPQGLSGKTALVTGGAKRLGRAVVEALAAAGAHVVIHHNFSARPAETLAEAVRAAGVNAWTVRGDLTDPVDAERVIGRGIDLAGRLDILVNNASIFPSDRLRDVTAASVMENVRVNALAPLVMSRVFAAQDREGCVINFLDTRILDYDIEHVSYHLSKRMLFTITRITALEFAPKIRVNAIAPGLILPPEGKDESYLEELAPTNPLRRYGSPLDVADAVLFLARSTFITGQVIFVDGGRHMRGGVYG